MRSTGGTRKGSARTTGRGGEIIEDKKLLTWTAGGLTRQALVPMRELPDVLSPRAGRRLTTAEAQRAANFKRSWKQLEMRIAANFPENGSGIVGCVTFDRAHRPRDRLQAQTRFAYYRGKKLAAARREAGLPPLKMIWAIEVLTSKSGNWHVHFIIDRRGGDYDLLRRCWIYGKDAEFSPLEIDRDVGYQRLAKYLSKEPRYVQDWKSRAGLHGWSATRNCVKPELDIVTVPGDYELKAPEGCVVFLDEERGGEFGEIREIEYMRRG